MPMTGPFRRLPAMARAIEKLGKPNSAPQKAIAKAVVKEVRELLKVQFATGTAPDGKAWKRTKRGKLALISRKLPQDFTGAAVAKGAAFWSRIPWLIAHHRGHVFPKRTQVLTFSKKGRLLSEKRQRRAKLVFDVTANVGPRELPERPIKPDHGMPDKWGKAVNKGIATAQAEINARIAKV